MIYLAVFIVGFGLALAGGLGVPRVGQNYVDPNLALWFLRWWPYAVSHGISPLYSHEIGAPAGYNLAAWTTSHAFGGPAHVAGHGRVRPDNVV